MVLLLRMRSEHLEQRRPVGEHELRRRARRWVRRLLIDRLVDEHHDVLVGIGENVVPQPGQLRLAKRLPRPGRDPVPCVVAAIEEDEVS